MPEPPWGCGSRQDHVVLLESSSNFPSKRHYISKGNHSSKKYRNLGNKELMFFSLIGVVGQENFSVRIEGIGG